MGSLALPEGARPSRVFVVFFNEVPRDSKMAYTVFRGCIARTIVRPLYIRKGITGAPGAGLGLVNINLDTRAMVNTVLANPDEGNVATHSNDS